ncbi:MAG: tetratricopeptide repeat protein [Parcubacteria group bacterium]|nr:tetratricopeptide repeat protein [Parcubacteria group bacterium]
MRKLFVFTVLLFLGCTSLRHEDYQAKAYPSNNWPPLTKERVGSNKKDELAEAYCRKGELYIVKGEYRLAIENFNEAIRLKENAKFYELRGSAHYLMGEIRKGDADYQKMAILRNLKK